RLCLSSHHAATHDGSTLSLHDALPISDKVRAKAEREVLAKVNKRIIRTEIKAAAAGKFNDVSDVFAYIKPEDFEVDDSGNVDETEISAAIEDLLKRKPYLGPKNRPRFQGT